MKKKSFFDKLFNVFLKKLGRFLVGITMLIFISLILVLKLLL